MIPLVLCIDDDRTTLMLNEFQLIDNGIAEKVNTANDAIEIIEALKELQLHNRREELPQLILLDLNMPAMDGWEFLDALATLDASFVSNLKIAILTSSRNEGEKKRAATYSNVIMLLDKPFTTESLQLLKTNEALAEFFK